MGLGGGGVGVTESEPVEVGEAVPVLQVEMVEVGEGEGEEEGVRDRVTVMLGDSLRERVAGRVPEREEKGERDMEEEKGAEAE